MIMLLLIFVRWAACDIRMNSLRQLNSGEPVCC